MDSTRTVPDDQPVQTQSTGGMATHNKPMMTGGEWLFVIFISFFALLGALWFVGHEDARRAWFNQEVEVSVNLDAGDYVIKYIRRDRYQNDGTPYHLVKCSKTPCTFKIDRQAHEFTFARNTMGDGEFYPDKVEVTSEGHRRDLARRCWKRSNYGWETNYTWCDYTLPAVPQPE
jgi:hypothetical protein